MWLFKLFLVFMSTLNYKYNLLRPCTLIMVKLGACIILSRKIRQLVNTWRPYHYTLGTLQFIDRITQLVFMLSNIRQLHLESTILIFQYSFLKQSLIMDLFQPKTPPSLSFSVMQQKPFIYCRNWTSSQYRDLFFSI